MNWQPTEDGNTRCPDHGRTFGSHEDCPDCPKGRAVTVEDNSAPQRRKADEDQILARKVRDEILGLARGLKDQREENESKDRIGFSTVAKLYDCALKWHRAATDERQSEDDKSFAEWLVKEKERMLGGSVSH